MILFRLSSPLILSILYGCLQTFHFCLTCPLWQTLLSYLSTLSEVSGLFRLWNQKVHPGERSLQTTSPTSTPSGVLFSLESGFLGLLHVLSRLSTVHPISTVVIHTHWTTWGPRRSRGNLYPYQVSLTSESLWTGSSPTTPPTSPTPPTIWLLTLLPDSLIYFQTCTLRVLKVRKGGDPRVSGSFSWLFKESSFSTGRILFSMVLSLMVWVYCKLPGVVLSVQEEVVGFHPWNLFFGWFGDLEGHPKTTEYTLVFGPLICKLLSQGCPFWFYFFLPWVSLVSPVEGR